MTYFGTSQITLYSYLVNHEQNQEGIVQDLHTQQFKYTSLIKLDAKRQQI